MGSSWDSEKYKPLFTILKILTMIVMVINFIGYSVVPELKNNHGRLIRCYIFTYEINFVLFVVLLILPADYFDSTVRLIVVTVQLYCDVSCALWLQVMSFDIWWNFRNLRCDDYRFRNGRTRKFIWYGFYAWVVPALLVALVNIDDALYLRHKDQSNARQLYDVISDWLYFSIVAMVSLCNIFFYVSMIRIIKRQKKETAALTEEFNQRHVVQKQGINLYVKLSFIMGIHVVPWTFLVFQKISIIMSWTIQVIELINSICIFRCFIWKDSVKQALRERFLSAMFCSRKGGPSESIATDLPALNSKPDQVPLNSNNVSTAVL